MSLNVDNVFVIDVGGFEVWITETIISTWFIMLIIIIFAIIARIKLSRFRVIPTGFQNVVEFIVESFDKFSVNTLGKNLSYISPWYFTVFAFILLSSLLSIFGLRAPTADFATTFALALASFALMIFMGLRHRKGKYLKSFFEPHFMFFPLNLIGELAKPVSLSFRLFGNVLSGTIILTLYYALTPIFVQFGIPALLHAFFDVLFGALQTYIFVIISLMYVKGAAE
ncbi:MAG: F0F1 ATP synthase subunit A [Eubacteriales bacterium]|nr:F0F1 ATP synthase subunit A [Eubacteriales bacterium]MDD4476379.1 F0F1 ATP synthase subunit A [Eubacteriales bacterium]